MVSILLIVVILVWLNWVSGEVKKSLIDFIF